jgi:hypothetical protein
MLGAAIRSATPVNPIGSTMLSGRPQRRAKGAIATPRAEGNAADAA